jgi:hypothetical protein
LLDGGGGRLMGAKTSNFKIQTSKKYQIPTLKMAV